mmetsp:Transcript_52858/g.153817  ORF Transcript_52858/g.153817 Transcript_52858/m.153817 type:complete len:231 (-) Transcript_52858:57-749(-)
MFTGRFDCVKANFLRFNSLENRSVNAWVQDLSSKSALSSSVASRNSYVPYCLLSEKLYISKPKDSNDPAPSATSVSRTLRSSHLSSTRSFSMTWTSTVPIPSFCRSFMVASSARIASPQITVCLPTTASGAASAIFCLSAPTVQLAGTLKTASDSPLSALALISIAASADASADGAASPPSAVTSRAALSFARSAQERSLKTAMTSSSEAAMAAAATPAEAPVPIVEVRA